ncbi:uncharacterized protein [Miscanthus floridulus]|uniref:uncharacterized protein n=1 Tax=Miscanthus floridulus TaxID=154761 RepID=UPI0034594C61
METPRLIVGAASLAPPPTPRFRGRCLLRPRDGVHCFPFARAARPTLLTRCSYYSFREGNDDSRGCWEFCSWTSKQIAIRHGELFSLAQRNILYINKQWLMAMEELKKLQHENNLLLEEIQVLETEMQGIPLEAAQSSSFSELLLQIDDLREKVVTNRSIWYSSRCRRTRIALA